ncbi:helix-turn-helix domain-containing protein [Streptomyces sp. NPDC048192]|uniref:helix-turn-helix domain-containing protein n=1 Tax=Streptomyces sp. NPDC048192 TaxID=3365510 RepID=UPI003721C3A8
MVAERFAVGEPSLAIAKELRVSVRLVQRWRRAWDRGGLGALRSAGPASLPRLTEAQLFVLERSWPRNGRHGWPDQRRTLARVETVIGRRFQKGYAPQGVALGEYPEAEAA